MGVSRGEVDYYLHEEPMRKFKRGEVEETVFWQDAITYWNIPIDFLSLRKWLYDSYEINQAVNDMVIQIRNNGYKACVVSNNFVTRVSVLQEKFGFLDNFDVTVFSYEVGVTKPNEAIFKELIKRANVSPEEIILTDDYEPNLRKIRELGITAFLYKSFGRFKDDLVKLGVRID